MSEFKQYRRTQIAELRPVTEMEAKQGFKRMMAETNISISGEDVKNGSPKVGDMIARNPQNHKDQWLVAKQYFEDNFEPLHEYNRVSDLAFGEALEILKRGGKIARKGWNGKGMFLAIQKGSVINSEQARGGVAKYLADDGQDKIKIGDHIDMKAADGSVVVGWLASQTDMLSEDWEIVE